MLFRSAVANALDQYVQPRFNILRDKNFGMLRIVYRKHAGVAQLKVDSLQEQEIIANVNATKRQYAIGILHFSGNPKVKINPNSAKLQLYYMNKARLITDVNYGSQGVSRDIANRNGIDLETLQEKAIAAMPDLMKGREKRLADGKWEVLLRPVLASRSDCLSCHTLAKQNSLLGVMFYAVQRDLAKPSPAQKPPKSPHTIKKGLFRVPYFSKNHIS